MTKETAQQAETAQEDKYNLHIQLDRQLQPVLQESAQLAFRMKDIPEPTLANLMNLFITWGLLVQKQKWLDRMGYQ